MECHVNVTPRLPAASYRQYRLDAIFSGKKWDPQIYDRSSIADRALVLGAADWEELKRAATALYHESVALEAELYRRAGAHAVRRFLPPRAWRLLRSLPEPATVDSARLMRFDFHPTADGWRVSEVNSDVPGGLNEASMFPQLWPQKSAGWSSPGNPGKTYVRHIAGRYALAPGSLVGLILATAYSDDWQHMAFLQDQFAELGVEAIGVSPTNVELEDREMRVRGARLAAALRFFPGDWLLFAARGAEWFARHPSRLCNPLHALFSQNKFFPIVCAAADIALPTWQRYLPRTHAPRLRDLFASSGVIKPSFGRVGEDVAEIAALRPKKRMALALDLMTTTGLWIRQERFEPQNLGCEREPINACVGVYCLDGEVIGGYARITSDRFIGISAADTPLFVQH